MPLIRKPKQPNYEDKPKSKLIKRVKLIDPNGKDGYTPIKGVDYFDGETPTDEQLIKLIRPLIPQVKDGIDGKTPTVDELLALIKPLIPEVKNGETPSDERLIALITPLIPEYKSITCEEVIDEINSKKEILDIKTIKGLSKEIESRIPKNMIGSPRIKMFKNGQEMSSPLGSLNVRGGNLTNDGQDYTINVDSPETQNLQAVTDIGSTTTNTIQLPAIQALTSAGGTIKSHSGANVAEFGQGGGQAWTFYDGVKLDAGTASRVLLTDANKNIAYSTLTSAQLEAIPTTYVPYTGATQITANSGTAAAPIYSFSGDTDTGAYRIGAGIYGIATAGVERARFTSTGATLTTPSSATGGVVGLTLAANTWTNSKLVNKLLASSVTITQSGTAGFTLIDVSYALNSVGSGEANLLRFSQTGTDYFKVAASGQMTTRLGSNTIPTHSFVGDTDTGMYSAGANILSFAVGGTNSFTLQSDFSGKFASTNPTLYLESTGTNAVNAGQIIYRTPSGSESFTTTFDASANIFNFKYGATTAFTITGSIVTSVLNHRFANGSASSPSISFTGDINTGLYYIAGDVMGISTGGAERMRVSNSYIIATVPFETYSYRAINSTDNILTEFRSYASSNGAGIYGQGNLIFNSGGGSSAYANMDFLAGETNTQIGGNMTFTGGLTEAGGYSGGYITMTGGYSYGGDGGYISIIGGSTVAANGGYVQIFGGDTSAGGGSAGGGVDIRGGYNSNTLQYATVYLQANGGITNIGATSFTVDTYGGAITSNIYHTFTANTSFYGTMQTQGMPTADPMDGQGTLWYDTSTNLVYRGT